MRYNEEKLKQYRGQIIACLENLDVFPEKIDE